MDFKQLISLFYLLVLCKISVGFPLGSEKSLENGVAEEKQNAICNIETKDIQVVANATVLRQIKGVCTSKELKLLLQDLKKEIANELKGIKSMLLSPDRIQLVTDIKTVESLNNNTIPAAITANDLFSIEQEIATFNNTIQKSQQEGDIFIYYWKIRDAESVLNKRNIYVSSPEFSLLGHQLKIRLVPNFNFYNFAVEIRTESKSFQKKYRLLIVDQNASNFEILSTVLQTGAKFQDQLFLVPTESVLKNKQFIDRDGTMIVKAILYVQS